MNVTVLGAGAWGTAFGQVLADAGNQVTMWAIEPEIVEGIRDHHHNGVRLPSVEKLPENWKELAEIDTQTANIILQDSILLKNKLEFLKRLYYINQGQKLVQQDKVALNEYYILYNKLSKFSVYIPDDWEGK